MFLSACQQSIKIKPDDNSNHKLLFDLTKQSNYTFSGKMSFSDGQEGGSGSVTWVSSDGLISTQLKAPLGSKSWQINELETGAELLTNANTYHADSAQTLISDQLGWKVPWNQLKSWVIGRAHNNQASSIEWHRDGFVVIEGGWKIEYSRLKVNDDVTSLFLPHKMIARKGSYSIKLIVRQWQW